MKYLPVSITANGNSHEISLKINIPENVNYNEL